MSDGDYQGFLVLWIHRADCPMAGVTLADPDLCTCGMPTWYALAIARDVLVDWYAKLRADQG